MSRCDSAAIVPNTKELLPEPEMPVNTVSRRLGISTLTSLRLFSRAPCTRIRSWLSATCDDGCLLGLVAIVVVSPSVGPGPPTLLVLNQPKDVAIGVGKRGHQTTTTDLARGLPH